MSRYRTDLKGDSPEERSSFPLLLLVCFLALITTILFAIVSATKPLWLDECHSVFVTFGGVKKLIEQLLHDSQPPFYFTALIGWTKVFGFAEESVRTFSWIFFLLSIPAMYLLGRSAKNHTVGVLSALFFAVSPLAIAVGMFVRMYSLLGFLTVLSLLFFVKLFIRKDRTLFNTSCYLLVNVLGTFTHYWFIFSLFAQGVAALLFFSKKSFRFLFFVYGASMLPFLVGWAPIVVQQASGSPTGWIEKPGLAVLLESILDFYGGNEALFIGAYFLSSIFFGAQIERKNSEDERSPLRRVIGYIYEREVFCFFFLFILTLLVPFLVSQYEVIYGSRYTIPALPPLAVCLSLVIVRFASSRLIFFGALLMMAGSLFALVRAEFKGVPYSDREATAVVLQEANDNDILLFTSMSYGPYLYYSHLLDNGKKFITSTYPAEMVLHPVHRDVQAFLSKPEVLERDANDILKVIAEAPTEVKVWVFSGYDQEVSSFLISRLDQSLKLIETKPIPGSSHLEIKVYRK